MKLVQINTSNNGSTGKIMLGISEIAQENNIESYIVCTNSRTSRKKKLKNQILVGNMIERNLHSKLGYFTGYNDCFSIFATLNILKKIEKINPDVIHLHNLHNCWINLRLLFKYIKSKNVKVIWTLHDCWSFTAYCPYFDITNCDKWKLQCNECMYKGYPKSLIDRSESIYNLKKKWFSGVKDMTIVTPSLWLKDLVQQSFLNQYEVKVINNGINLNTFYSIKSNFKEKYNIENKFVILGIAFSWGYRKGLDIFEELSYKLDDNFKIVLVGVSDKIKEKLPNNIICINKTENQKELAEIYSGVDVFLNPTREDNFPTVNIEALACGTPVLTFNTGGSPEIITEKVGRIVDINNIVSELQKLKSRNYDSKDCIAHSKNYNEKNKFQEYVNLYLNI